ncbi:hypothetical protein GCM10011578_064200 [Streptomyces fuscichromogenes]|uniref:DUF3558 domain-containing protein n=2 Tax=Streptomyces fuscichromogenes TaxID=1324013 RepID=A0A918CUJ0_9ACTN|nr:DUF3558 family protein [Streptomyces fuscichromogenes]GGN28268.1 hypothetical protein GCM10011578_064200 [Streptomyces fuscichromogenes]
MQRVAVQRDDQRARSERSAQRRAGRLRRALVCAAAVPAVALSAAACSSDSGSAAQETGGGSSNAGTAPGGSTEASPTVQAAKYQKLPEPCAVLSKQTLTALVPKGVKSGKEGKSDDVATRGSCSWSSLDNNGVKGSQFRWLNISFLRFDSDTSRGSGEQQATAYYTSQVQGAQAVTGAKNTKSVPVAGAGDQATLVRYDLKKKEGAFKQQTVVARVSNVVVTLDYNGAGLAGEKTPDANALVTAAEKAAKEAVASVTMANGSATTPSSPAATPSKSASGSPSASASASKSSSKKS